MFTFMIRVKGREWRVVSKQEYIAAERATGIHGHVTIDPEPMMPAFTGRVLEGRIACWEEVSA